MPQPAHNRITYSGIFTNGVQTQEIWSCNVNTILPLSAQTVSSITTLAQQAWVAWNTNIKPLMTADVRVTRVRVAQVDTSGHVARAADGSYIQGDTLTVSTGSGTAATGTGFLPLQTALVVSLDSTAAGASGKGRVFLPFPRTQSINDDYRISTAAASGVAQAAKAWLNGVATNVGAPVVISPTKNSLASVVAVRVGTVPDTMRSRRGTLLEAYQRVTLV